jgi:hypothetical protein
VVNFLNGRGERYIGAGNAIMRILIRHFVSTSLLTHCLSASEKWNPFHNVWNNPKLK